MLDLLYWKITERFTRLANAFKFFDSSADGSINFSEFLFIKQRYKFESCQNMGERVKFLKET